MKILIVEDSLTMRRIILNVLKQLGFQDNDCHEAENGLDALKLLEKNKYDIILTDWNMPKMSGLEMVKYIRMEDEFNKNTPIIMITTEGAKEEVISALKAGVTNYIVKPFNAETLKGKLESVMKRLAFVI